jgi:dienelactone hydrolase
MRLFTTVFLGLVLFISCQKDAQRDSSLGEDKEMTEGIVGEVYSYSSDSVDLVGYFAYDSSAAPKPGILVVHEWWGHNDYVRERARQLAELGYTAFALDMYGEGKKAEHPQDAGKFSKMVMSNMDLAKARFEAAMETLKNHPYTDTSGLAAVGYCFGGSVVLSMANAGYDLDAVAAFHSGVQLPVPPSEDLKARVLVANGEDDKFIPEESVASFKAAMDSVGADYEYISYEGAVHSYTNPMADSMAQKFDMPIAYNARAESLAWLALKKLLAAEL